MRFRPLVTLSIATAAVLLLAGCASTGDVKDASPSTTGAAGDLCAAAAPSGAASESIKVKGDVGKESVVTFSAPLEVEDLQRTVIEEGSGDPVSSGDLITYALSAFSAETGEKLGAVGYAPGEILPTQISPDSPLGAVIGCASPGTRVVATFPASEQAAGEVYIFDFLEIVPNSASGTDEAPVDGMPTVVLGDDGAPTITIPDGAAPTEVELATLKQGDGEVVEAGDKVLVHYTGVKWSDGSVFDSSWTKGAPASFETTNVVDGFKQALEGAKVGSQVLVVMPPSAGYGEKSDANTSPLAGETLVFVVDILGVQHAAAE